MPSTAAYVKALVGGGILCIGGPAFVMWVSPTEEEIFKRYNPDLQKRALAMRGVREKEFDDFVMELKEASKSKKPIWTAQKEIEAKRSEERAKRAREEHDALNEQAEKLKAEIRESAAVEHKPVSTWDVLMKKLGLRGQ